METKKLINAYCAVAKMLVPNMEITKVSETTTMTKGLTKVSVVVMGIDDMGREVLVTDEMSDNGGGLQIVVEKRINTMWKRVNSTWYFSFNWKGLMETSKDVFK